MEGLSLWFALFKAEVVGSEGVGSRGGYWGLSSVAGRLINTCVFGRAPSTRMNRRSCKVWEALMSCVLLPVHDRRYAYNMMPNCLIPLIPMPSHDSSRPSLPEASRKVATSSTPLSACHSTAQGLGVDHPRNGRTDANSIRSCGTQLTSITSKRSLAWHSLSATEMYASRDGCPIMAEAVSRC
jgi:hypothetical protein